MFDPSNLFTKAELVIGPNERAILNAASTKIDTPQNTTVGLIKMAIREVKSSGDNYIALGMSKTEFVRHKRNLLNEMDEAIKAASAN
ncbi:hypothetical protein HUO09_17120 [Vibrio sp. Y2-5]|uniref:hypothetical protein n=1 Tax=Vibrio sp. Y2-5 TaxID=2743977 RepID=UPI0016611609|nr:hypothetical protein [Vibrio sp. Y2-5]MBD0788078.1 hypothetical protein [Vibrio sp. Y2-5]